MNSKSFAAGCIWTFDIVLSVLVVSVSTWACGRGGFVFGVLMSLVLVGVTMSVSKELDEKERRGGVVDEDED